MGFHAGFGGAGFCGPGSVGAGCFSTFFATGFSAGFGLVAGGCGVDKRCGGWLRFGGALPGSTPVTPSGGACLAGVVVLLSHPVIVILR